MNSKFSPLSRHRNLVVQELINEVLIYDLQTDKACCLNEISALVWKSCDGTRSVAEIAESVAEKLNSPVPEDLVWLALDLLRKENLLANGEEVTPKFKGMSRRDVIRRIGLTSAVALPVISSLVAPAAAAAQSSTCTPLADACVKEIPCCPHYSGPTACIDVSQGNGVFVCLIIPS